MIIPADRSDSFVSMCGFIAIRQSQEGDIVMKELLLHCFALLPDETFRDAASFRVALRSLFQLDLPSSRVQSALDKLLNAGEVQRLPTGKLLLSPATGSRIGRHVEEASSLEAEVREEWVAHCVVPRPGLEAKGAWQALTHVLYQMFRAHGLQTMALLDSSLELSAEDERSPRAIIRSVAAEFAEVGDLQRALEESILEFLAGAGSNANRARYLSQLADCTVSYLSLTVPPEVAKQLSAGLKSLDLFLDTNVLFDVIGLGDQALSFVAQDLARAVTQHRLPLALRCHEATERELLATFDGLAAGLRSTVWTPAMSAAAARAPYINSITRRYHERNAEAAISAESFLQPYEHIDVIIREKGVTLYRDRNPAADQTIYDLQHDFEAFLRDRNRDRQYEAIIHDMTVLTCVRRLRSTARSSLEARALFVTNDVMLHIFDREQSRGKACTILPRQLLQLLRPFVPATDDFDRAFAAAFAVPEFRSMNARAAAATSKMLQILATYRDFSEKTATSLLANDLLLGKLQSAADEAEMRELVESAIVEQNASLVEERDALAARLERMQREREHEVESARSALTAEHDRERNDLRDKQRQLEERARELESVVEREQEAAKVAQRRASETGASLENLQRRLATIEEANAKANAEATQKRAVLAFVIRDVAAAGLLPIICGLAAAGAAYSGVLDRLAPLRRSTAIAGVLTVTLAYLAWVHARGKSIPAVAKHRLFVRFSAAHKWLYAVLITGVIVNIVSDAIKMAAAPQEDRRPLAPAESRPQASQLEQTKSGPASPRTREGASPR